MIKVPKSTLPQSAIDELKKCEKRFETAKATARKNKKKDKLRPNYSVVKPYLVKDFSGKCAYCEAYTRHISPGQTDHVLPVSKNPKLVFVWSNLVLACENCNRKKNAYQDTHLPLINPLVDTPSNHLTFSGPMILHLDNRGEATWTELELNRGELMGVRTERLLKLNVFFDRLKIEKDPSTKKMIVSQLKRESEPHREYSLMVEIFVQQQLASVTI